MIGEFIIYALATWRIASLLATEDGPFGVFSELRQELGVYYEENAQGALVPHANNVIGKGTICIWCSSIWFGLLFVVLGRGLPELTVYLVKNGLLSYRGAAIALTLVLIAAKTTFYVALPLAISAGAVIINGVVEWHEQAHQRS